MKYLDGMYSNLLMLQMSCENWLGARPVHAIDIYCPFNVSQFQVLFQLFHFPLPPAPHNHTVYMDGRSSNDRPMQNLHADGDISFAKLTYDSRWWHISLYPNTGPSLDRRPPTPYRATAQCDNHIAAVGHMRERLYRPPTASAAQLRFTDRFRIATYSAFIYTHAHRDTELSSDSTDTPCKYYIHPCDPRVADCPPIQVRVNHAGVVYGDTSRTACMRSRRSCTPTRRSRPRSPMTCPGASRNVEVCPSISTPLPFSPGVTTVAGWYRRRRGRGGFTIATADRSSSGTPLRPLGSRRGGARSVGLTAASAWSALGLLRRRRPSVRLVGVTRLRADRVFCGLIYI